MKLDPTESKTIYKEIYDLFPGEVYTSYDKLQNFAREYVLTSLLLFIVTLYFSLNTQIPVLEVVVVGPKGSGKTSIVEALLGRSITNNFGMISFIFFLLSISFSSLSH